uniref:COMM domain-containing protein n=1 Tax=Knipowitschia caucasica TaxID=637954 RepID=A0AAV2L3Z4_KNICA
MERHPHGGGSVRGWCSGCSSDWGRKWMDISPTMQLSEADFLDSLLVLGFSKEVNDMLLQLYQQQGPQVCSVLSQMRPTLPEYHSLEWRLDVHVSRRALRQQLCPVMTLCLALTEGGTGEQSTRRLLQARPSTLLHLLRELESALDAMKSTHTRRILRNVK